MAGGGHGKIVEAGHADRHEGRGDEVILLEQLRERNRAEWELAAGVREAARDRGQGGSGDGRSDRALRECYVRKEAVVGSRGELVGWIEGVEGAEELAISHPVLDRGDGRTARGS